MVVKSTKPRRFRLRWICLTTSVALVVVMLATLIVSVSWGVKSFHLRGYVAGGAIGLLSSPSYNKTEIRVYRPTEWRFTPAWETHYIPGVPGSSVEFICIPFSLLLLPFILLTVIMFRRDRRPAPGHCINCGYNLKGLLSNRCPECGLDQQENEEN